LMHMQGTPESMQTNPEYANVLVDVKDFLRERMEFARSMGVEENAVVVDPGIGFGKTDAHNLQLLAGLEYLRLLQRPILVGASRKGFLGRLAGIEAPAERVHATVAAHSAAVLQGAGILRVHDVKAARQAAAVLDGVRQYL
jgi:dihydropteroate synthase